MSFSKNLFADDGDITIFLQEVFEEFMIPRVDIEAGKKARIVQFVVERNLRPIVENRESLFDHSQPISAFLAKKMLIQGYKQTSKFGKWCPVQVCWCIYNSLY